MVHRHFQVLEGQAQTGDSEALFTPVRTTRRVPISLRVAGSVMLCAMLVTAGLVFLPSTGKVVRATGRVGATNRVQTLGQLNNASSTVVNASSSGVSGDNVIEVDVHGDVKNPGVVQVPSNARVKDVIRAAGGFRHDKDAMNINQAALVWDGEEVDVPSSSAGLTGGQVAVASTVASGSASPQTAITQQHSTLRIDINTANLATLETLPDVGPKRASELIAYRSQHGPITSLTELGQVKGIGAKTIAKWAPLLYFPTMSQAP